MAKEPDGYREQLARLTERFPDKEAITMQEVCAVIGRKDYRPLTKDKSFPAKKAGGQYSVPLTKLAWWLSS